MNASPESLLEIASDKSLMEVGRKAIEDALVEWRDAGLSQPTRGNGFCIRYADGTPSPIVRFGPETGVAIALRAIAESLAARAKGQQ